jgi:hypothetical protein
MFRRILLPIALAVLASTVISGSSLAHNHPNPDPNISLAVATFAPDDPGTFLDEGPYGTGWHYFSTDDDQIFIHHPGQSHFYAFDFGVTRTGQGSSHG